MNKYATEQSFGGQRASVGRQVLVVESGGVQPGLVTAIASNDKPIVRVFGVYASGHGDSALGVTAPIEFRACATEAILSQEIASTPGPFWTWPPKL